jgi:hypothetical protein
MPDHYPERLRRSAEDVIRSETWNRRRRFLPAPVTRRSNPPRPINPSKD